MSKLFGIVVLLLGLAAVAFSVKTALQPRGGSQTEPKRQLDNVRTRAHELEREQQKAADDIAKRAAEQ